MKFYRIELHCIGDIRLTIEEDDERLVAYPSVKAIGTPNGCIIMGFAKGRREIKQCKQMVFKEALDIAETQFTAALESISTLKDFIKENTNE